MPHPRFTELQGLRDELATHNDEYNVATDALIESVFDLWADQIDDAIDGAVPVGVIFPRDSGTAGALKELIRRIIISALKTTDHFSEL